MPFQLTPGEATRQAVWQRAEVREQDAQHASFLTIPQQRDMGRNPTCSANQHTTRPTHPKENQKTRGDVADESTLSNSRMKRDLKRPPKEASLPVWSCDLDFVPEDSLAWLYS